MAQTLAISENLFLKLFLGPIPTMVCRNISISSTLAAWAKC